MPPGAAPTRLRRATAVDAAAVADVVRAAFARYVPRLGGEPWPMRLDYSEVVARGATWVAEQGGGIVGALVLEDQPDHLLLDVIAVAPDRQGGGVGHGLMTLGEEQARELGHDQVRLSTNEVMTENLAYYPRQGYVETHRDTVHGFHRVFFTKTLRP